MTLDIPTETAGAPEAEIEVTPAMIEAGARVLYGWAGGAYFAFGGSEGRAAAERVFREMEYFSFSQSRHLVCWQSARACSDNISVKDLYLENSARMSSFLDNTSARRLPEKTSATTKVRGDFPSSIVVNISNGAFAIFRFSVCPPSMLSKSHIVSSRTNSDFLNRSVAALSIFLCDKSLGVEYQMARPTSQFFISAIR